MASSSTESQETERTDVLDVILGEEDALILQDYDVGRTLGSGKHGKVKEAFHRLSGLPVALKVMEKQGVVMSKEINSEVQALGRLSHPNIVRMYDVIVTHTHVVLVLELMTGGELFDYIVVRTTLSEKDARKFLRQILAGLRSCHAAGIVHRDLKLENILLDASGNAKIADFGFSRIFQEGALMNTFVGSMAYAAPEILANESYDGTAADVWSFGVIAYSLMVGRQPFDHTLPYATFYRTVQSAGYDLPDDISPEGRDFIRHMLQVSPSLRPSIEALCTHPWINIGYEHPPGAAPDERVKSIVSNEPGWVPDPFIVAALSASNIDLAGLDDDLRRGTYTRATAAYRLLAEKRQRDRQLQLKEAEIAAIASRLAMQYSPNLSRMRSRAASSGRRNTGSGSPRSTPSLRIVSSPRPESSGFGTPEDNKIPSPMQSPLLRRRTGNSASRDSCLNVLGQGLRREDSRQDVGEARPGILANLLRRASSKTRKQPETGIPSPRMQQTFGSVDSIEIVSEKHGRSVEQTVDRKLKARSTTNVHSDLSKSTPDLSEQKPRTPFEKVREKSFLGRQSTFLSFFPRRPTSKPTTTDNPPEKSKANKEPKEVAAAAPKPTASPMPTASTAHSAASSASAITSATQPSAGERRTSAAAPLRHNLFNAETTSSKGLVVIQEEIKRVCTLNRVRYSQQGATFTCTWHLDRREKRASLEGRVLDYGPVHWEIEICKLERLDLHGIRLRRLDGDIWVYKHISSKLLQDMHL